MINEVKEIDAKEFKILKSKAFTLVVDVREHDEFQSFNVGGFNMPAHLLKENLQDLEKYKTLIIICSNGLRSQIMARVIQKKIPSAKVFHLTEGINS
jgi:rhodanese-related sulfurtransferase